MPCAQIPLFVIGRGAQSTSTSFLTDILLIIAAPSFRRPHASRWTLSGTRRRPTAISLRSLVAKASGTMTTLSPRQQTGAHHILTGLTCARGLQVCASHTFYIHLLIHWNGCDKPHLAPQYFGGKASRLPDRGWDLEQSQLLGSHRHHIHLVRLLLQVTSYLFPAKSSASGLLAQDTLSNVFGV